MGKTTKGLMSIAATVTLATTFATASADAASYQVKSGDTLWAIAQNNSTTVSALQSANNISGHLIYPGQVIETSSNSNSYSPQVKSTSVSYASNGYDVVNEAKRHIGTPFVWGGSAPGGFDCSGFVSYVFNKTGDSIGRTSAANYYNQSAKVSSPSVGDLVFFANTGSASGISHMGIYAGNNTFVHAANDGVQVTSLSNSYWSKHFVGYGSL